MAKNKEKKEKKAGQANEEKRACQDYTGVFPRETRRSTIPEIYF